LGAPPGRFDGIDLFPALFVAMGLFTYHALVSAISEYGYFIDELYYIAWSKRLAFGYVDHPPVAILIVALNTQLLGDSLPALRMLPSLALAATVFTTSMITRQFGGSRWAIVTASLAGVAMPVFLRMGSF
jgi:4-amino-4-deoxy-L-arabinose transferase-like glycosyltransferase